MQLCKQGLSMDAGATELQQLTAEAQKQAKVGRRRLRPGSTFKSPWRMTMSVHCALREKDIGGLTRICLLGLSALLAIGYKPHLVPVIHPIS